MPVPQAAPRAPGSPDSIMLRFDAPTVLLSGNGSGCEHSPVGAANGDLDPAMIDGIATDRMDGRGLGARAGGRDGGVPSRQSSTPPTARFLLKKTIVCPSAIGGMCALDDERLFALTLPRSQEVQVCEYLTSCFVFLALCTVLSSSQADDSDGPVVLYLSRST